MPVPPVLALVLLIVQVLFTTLLTAVPVVPAVNTASLTFTEKTSTVPVLFVIVTGLYDELPTGNIFEILLMCHKV